MNKILQIRCDCCGLMVDPTVTEDCPRCKYPVKADKEERFLESSIHDLQRVSAYGGGSLKVDELIRRYRSRLYALRKYSTFVAPAVPPVIVGVKAPVASGVATPSSLKVPLEVNVAAVPISQQQQLPEKHVVTPPPTKPQPPRHVFSWREFFADQAINIVASVGAFLLLIGSLSFIITTSNLFVTFLVLFIVHAIFGITGFVTYRFQTFRFVASIYTIIFALLIPLVAFSLYRLLIGSNIQFSVPVLIAISATYAAVIYILMAVYQRFIPFAYLGLIALLVADLAVSDALHLYYWWWPSMAMILAIPATISLKRGSENTWPFTGHWGVLRDPIHYVMYLIVAASLLSLCFMLVYSLGVDLNGSPISELRFSILCMTLLLLIWATLSIWLAKWNRLVIVLAFLVLASVLAVCYALRFEVIGYALALTCVALLYHGLNRFASQRLEPFGILSLGLDQIALVLVLIVPLISSPLLPLQLYASAFSTSLDSTSLIYQTSWRTLAELVAVGVGILLTLSVTFYRAGLAKTPSKARWCWLLLLGGFLINWEYSIVVLSFHISPVWAFFGLALAFVAGTVIVRRLYSPAWSNPLDTLALLEIVFTLSLSINQDQNIISALLLFFAALLYLVVLYQNRQNLLFLPLIFALLAIPTLWYRPLAMLLLGFVLPLASVVVHRFVTNTRNITQGQNLTSLTFIQTWEWPLLITGLVYGILSSFVNYANSMSAMYYTFGIHIPIAIEIALLAVTWYVSSALTRIKLWLIPSVGFAIGALLIPTNSFWVLLVLTPLLAIFGVAISRFADRSWSLPFYIVAVISAVITGYTGYTQEHLLVTSLALLCFAALTYIIGVIEKSEFAMWIMPAFAIWSVIISAGFLGDLYRPPIVALVCAALGVSVKYFRLEPLPFFGSVRRNKFLTYALPFYATALAAAILTGVYGTVANINNPFYGAVPDALLIYAFVAFAVLVFEKQPRWLWLVAGFAIWGTYLAFELSTYYLFGIALGMAFLGLVVGFMSKRMMSTREVSNFLESLRQFTWSWPFYATALVAAFLTGVHGTGGNINSPFYGAIPNALLIYALVTFAVLVLEKQPVWLWLTACFAIWSTLLSLELTAYYLFGIGLAMALLGLVVGLVSKRMMSTSSMSKSLKPLRQFTWSWPWYLTALVAVVSIWMWTSLFLTQPISGFIGYSMLAFTIIAIVIMIVERFPELLVFPAGLAVATIWLWEKPPLDFVPLMIAYSLLCLVVFASQFTWKIILPASRWVHPAVPHALLGLGGQTIVVLSIISQGGLTSNGPTLLAIVGAGALLELALLLLWYGYLHTGIVASMNMSENNTQKRFGSQQQAKILQHWCYYVAGLLCSLVISWELLAFGQTRIDILLLAPASYLSVVSPFVMRDQTLPGRHWAGQVVAISGAILLLLPALWFSFSDSNLLPTLVLIGESLALLLLGIATRVRIFILSSAALLLVGALRALFLSTPPSLFLMLLGVILVVIATVLFLVRRRLKIAWTQWE
ncbi:MAG: hypothetical protein ACXVDN_02225 [Ktedonobacteraceae bacterium]